MAEIALGQRIRVRVSGGALVPLQPIDLLEGEELELTIVNEPSDESPDQVWQRVRSSIGVIDVPPPANFDWNLSREDFY